jgi:hypothetical protein
MVVSVIEPSLMILRLDRKCQKILCFFATAPYILRQRSG